MCSSSTEVYQPPSFTFSKVDFMFSEVNSSLSTLLSSPLSSLIIMQGKSDEEMCNSIPVEGLVVFKVLAQSLQEETELPELYEVWTMFIGSFGNIFNMVEAPVNCRDGIKELIDRNYITNSLN